jgi:carbamoyl-phosphate synthase/aspartate carbamoyltransferase/dihydroorotase
MDAFVILQAPVVYNAEGCPRICVVDCGLKYNQLRCLLMRGARLDVVQWDHILNPEQFDGLFLSNGPGDPAVCGVAFDNIRKVMLHEDHKPIFGICLGHQLLAVAAGCSTFKMK